MSYAKIHEEYWDGEKIRALSDRAALLGLFLLSGPHRNAIGCFRLGIGAITDIPRFGGWGIEGVSKALLEMADTGFIVRDDATGWTLVVNHLKKDPINNPKAAIHAAALGDRVPKPSLVYQRLVEILGPQLEPFSKALNGKAGWPMARPIEGAYEGASKGHTKPQPSPSPSPSPLPEPEPERGGEDARARESSSLGVGGDEPLEQPLPATDPAVALIEAFDRGIISAFGANLRRPWPSPTDLGTARTWLEAGADAALVEAATHAACERKREKGERVPPSLSSLNFTIADAIAASKRPLPEAANGSAEFPSIPAFLDRRQQRDANTDAAFRRGMAAAVEQRAGAAEPVDPGGGGDDDPLGG